MQFFGPDKLNLRGSMTIRELDALRDREHFKRLLTHAGVAGLRKEILALVSHRRRSQVNHETVRDCATNYEPEHNLQRASALSPEKGRLAEVYCRTSMQALLDELKTSEIH
jgi:hypothetical protein